MDLEDPFVPNQCWMHEELICANTKVTRQLCHKNLWGNDKTKCCIHHMRCEQDWWFAFMLRMWCLRRIKLWTLRGKHFKKKKTSTFEWTNEILNHSRGLHSLIWKKLSRYKRHYHKYIDQSEKNTWYVVYIRVDWILSHLPNVIIYGWHMFEFHFPQWWWNKDVEGEFNLNSVFLSCLKLRKDLHAKNPESWHWYQTHLSLLPPRRVKIFK